MLNIKEITDFQAPELDIYARLTETQLRSHHGIAHSLFIAESPHVIERALAAGYEPESLLMLHRHMEGQGLPILEKCGDIPAYVSDEATLKQLTGFPMTRGVLCAMKRKPLKTVEEICTDAKRVVVLEDVMNPTNLGAIFRSAAAMGMDALLLTPACTDPLYRRSVRVSMGTVFQIPWARLDSLDTLKQAGFVTLAMALRKDALRKDALSLDDSLLNTFDKLAVVLGTEGDGLTRETIEGCDHTVMIPMAHGVDSLNVGNAAAVAFWALRKKN